MWFLLLMLVLGVYMQSLMHMQIVAEQTGAYNVVCVLAVGCTVL